MMSAKYFDEFLLEVTRIHSWSLVVTRGHSESFVVTRGHSCVLLDTIFFLTRAFDMGLFLPQRSLDQSILKTLSSQAKKLTFLV